jgi:hypothetical protein
MKLKTSLFLFLAIFASLTNNQAANIPINYLPFKITAPGTYVLNSDLTAPYSRTQTPAITTYQPVGFVVIDLQGHTIHAAPVPARELNNNSFGILMDVEGGAAGFVTIQNGTLEGFAVGLVTSTSSPDKGGGDLIKNITFKNDLTSSVNSIAIHLVNTGGVNIVGCKFIGAGKVGIFDEGSYVGNGYSNLYFDGTLTTNIQVTARLTFPQLVSFSSSLVFPWQLPQITQLP